MKHGFFTVSLAASFFILIGVSQKSIAEETVAIATPSKANGDSNKNSVTGIDVTKDGESSLVRILMNNQMSALPNGFSASNPPRVAVDIANATSAMPSNIQELADSNVKSVAIVQGPAGLRLVFNLRQQMTHEIKLDGKSFLIRFFKPESIPESSVKKFADGDNSASHSISGFDFRRGPSGEARVLVDMSDTNTGIDIKRHGKNLVVDFNKASVAESLRRRMNVADFGTVVQDISVDQRADGVSMVIEPLGDWEYNAYQADRRFVVEVKKRVIDESSVLRKDPKFSGEKLNLNFQNVDVRNLLNVIADFTKLNIVAADNVQGTITVRLQDVPWDQALDIVLSTRGLDMRRRGNVIWVAPREEIAKREKEALESQSQMSELEATRTEAFRLNYSKADEVAALLNNASQRILSKRGSVVIDRRTNQLFVQDIGSKLDEVSRIISKVDIPIRQVQIEAGIVEASDSFGQSLGARLGFFSQKAIGPRGSQLLPGAFVQPGTYTQPSDASSAPFGLGSFGTSVPQVNLPAQALGTASSPASFALSLFNSAASRILTLELSAAEADGRGKIISSPRVVTGDQEKALIEQGTELPYQQASSSGATNIAFKKANLKLEVTPQITPDGNVIMEVDINKDAPGAPTVGGLAIDTKHVETKVLIENGGTVVIGGIYTQDERSDVDKVPLLGDLPGIGNLFRTTTRRDNKTELLIFLTPRILSDGVSKR